MKTNNVMMVILQMEMDALQPANKKTRAPIQYVNLVGHVIMETVCHLKMGLLVMMEIQLQ